MVWHDWKTGPTADPAAADMLAAYEAAWKARKSTADCYHAGVGASSPGSNAGVRRAAGCVGDPRGEGQPAHPG